MWKALRQQSKIGGVQGFARYPMRPLWPGETAPLGGGGGEGQAQSALPARLIFIWASKKSTG